MSIASIIAIHVSSTRFFMMIVFFHPIFHPSSLHVGCQIWKIHAPSSHCSMVVQCDNMSLVDHVALKLILPIQFHINWQAPTCINNNCFRSHQLYTPFYCDLNKWMNYFIVFRYVEFFYTFVTPNLAIHVLCLIFCVILLFSVSTVGCTHVVILITKLMIKIVTM